MKAYMSLNFGQIPPLTTQLAALERLKNRCHHVMSLDNDPIFFKLASNKDMHNIMSSNFGQGRSDHRLRELAALERLRNTPIDL